MDKTNNSGEGPQKQTKPTQEKLDCIIEAYAQ